MLKILTSYVTALINTIDAMIINNLGHKFNNKNYNKIQWKIKKINSQLQARHEIVQIKTHLLKNLFPQIPLIMNICIIISTTKINNKIQQRRNKNGQDCKQDNQIKQIKTN